MARARIRTRSGRLRASERRRRLNKAALQPGEVILLDRTRLRHKGRRGSSNSLSVEWVADAQVAVDLDVRKLLHELRLNLAAHYQAALLAGKRADGRGDLPQLRDKTLALDPGRSADSFGVRSGQMAKRWLLLRIRGSVFKATTRIKPWGGDGRSFMINRLLRRGVDFQSVTGTAAEVIRQTIEDWLHRAVPTSGDGVATPRRVPHNGGELPRFRR